MVEIKNEGEEKRVESPLNLSLVQTLPKSQEKIDLIIQKAVELGVSSIHPIFTQRCEIKPSSNINSEEWNEKKLNHWKGIIQSSCEQCGRNILPTISSPLSFSKFLINYITSQKESHQKLRESLQLIFVPSSNSISLSALKQRKHSVHNICFIIGPEGGFSEEE